MVQRRPTEIVQVNLRLQEGLRKKIVADAEKSGRSFNQWMVDAAEEALRGANIESIVRRAVTDTGDALLKEVRALRDSGERDE
jgi:uncharacterized protein (DUF1778 family)